MKNLAGVVSCDNDIRRELMRCLIPAETVLKGNTEVPYSVIGKLGNITFWRGWYYWVVKCRVPLSMAEELYADPVGKDDIRAAGHASGPSPSEEVEYIDKDGNILYDLSRRPVDERTVKVIEEKGYRFVEDPTKEGQPFITNYHIDSEIGLRIFADTMKRHGLAA